jgi:hypothetical protein
VDIIKRESFFEQSSCVTPEAAFPFAQKNSYFLIHNGQPRTEFTVLTSMMLQARNSERPRVSLLIE